MTSSLGRTLLVTAALLVAACSDAGENLGVPEGPKLLLAEAVSMTSVRLRWPRAEIAGLRSYRIERRADLSGAFAELAVVPAAPGDTAVYFDTTVEPDRIYGYRVSAIGSVGGATDYSVTAGVRTPPHPGIDVRITTTAPAPTQSDPDGYLVRIEGPTATSGAVGIGDPQTPFVRRFNPLAPGDYAVVLSGVASNCQVPSTADPAAVADTIHEVTVTDVGVQTIANVSFAVVCRDPTRGTIEAAVTVTGATTNGQAFQVLTSGLADDTSLPDDQRAYAQTRDVAEGGGPALFDNVRPGTYEVELRNVGAGCTVTGETKRPVTLAVLDIAHIAYAVECGGSGGGEIDDPSKPFKLRSQWSNPAAAAGSTVALDVTLALGDSPPFVLGTTDVLTRFSTTVLRADSVLPGPGFTVSDNRGTAGVVAWSVLSPNPAPATGPIPLVRIWFTVVGSAGATTRTATTVNEIGDENGDVGNATASYASLTQPFPEATLTVGTSGGGGGGTNQPPVAVIAGGNPITAVPGTAVTFTATGSSDADGTIATYAWSFPGATPATATGAEAAATYATAGSYTATLTVVDDDGASATTTRAVSVTAPGGGNQPPVAVIAGANPVQATVGAAVALSASGSSDPDGGTLTYTWALPGGSPASATGSSATTSYAAAGSYTATLTVADGQGGTGTATRTITVSPPSTPITWRNSFAAADANGVVPMTVTLDLRTDLTETPGPEQVQSFRADSITWDATLLTYDSTRFAANINGTTGFDPVRPGRLKLQGSAVGDGPTGLVQLATVYFSPQSGATGTTSTTTWLGKILGTPATNNFEYLTRATIAEGTYPASGGPPPPTVGTVTGTVTRAGTGGQSLDGSGVTVDPSAAGAPSASGTLSGTGATATFSVAVEVGSGSGAGAGSVALGGLPSGCTVTTPAGGSASYAGLAAGGSQSVAFTVTCTGTTPPPTGKYLFKSTWGTIAAGQVDLVIAVDPSGFDSPLVTGADGVGGLQAVTTLTGSAAGRFTAVTPIATNGFAPATIGPQPLPSVSWLTSTTQGERTTLADVATLRFTIGTGAAGSVTTSTQVGELSTANGDALPIDDDGSAANGLGNTSIIEGTLSVP